MIRFDKYPEIGVLIDPTCENTGLFTKIQKENDMPQIPSQVVALVFIAGFAIQQTLQILDSFGLLQFIKAVEKEGAVFGIPTADFKKSLMLLIASVLGILLAFALPIHLLSYVLSDINIGLDAIISGLVVGSGTEATNIALKYFGYLKDAQKEALIEISITPLNPTISRDQTLQFFAVVGNSKNKLVDWKVVQGDGGAIDAAGLYRAPGIAGTFQVVAISKADSGKIATTTVTVK
jgi:hypothetical protein